MLSPLPADRERLLTEKLTAGRISQQEFDALVASENQARDLQLEVDVCEQFEKDLAVLDYEQQEQSQRDPSFLLQGNNFGTTGITTQQAIPEMDDDSELNLSLNSSIGAGDEYDALTAPQIVGQLSHLTEGLILKVSNRPKVYC